MRFLKASLVYCLVTFPLAIVADAATTGMDGWLRMCLGFCLGVGMYSLVSKAWRVWE